MVMEHKLKSINIVIKRLLEMLVTSAYQMNNNILEIAMINKLYKNNELLRGLYSFISSGFYLR